MQCNHVDILKYKSTKTPQEFYLFCTKQNTEKYVINPYNGTLCAGDPDFSYMLVPQNDMNSMNGISYEYRFPTAQKALEGFNEKPDAITLGAYLELKWLDAVLNYPQYVTLKCNAGYYNGQEDFDYYMQCIKGVDYQENRYRKSKKKLFAIEELTALFPAMTVTGQMRTFRECVDVAYRLALEYMTKDSNKNNKNDETSKLKSEIKAYLAGEYAKLSEQKKELVIQTERVTGNANKVRHLQTQLKNVQTLDECRYFYATAHEVIRQFRSK